MNTKKFLSAWIPIAVAGTVIIALVYAVIQQGYRQSANDAQIEFARNAADYLSQGVSPELLMGGLSKTDMTKSLSIFSMIFDQNGKISLSTAVRGSTLTKHTDGDPYVPPAGVFDYVRAHGEDRITWQTSGGQRYAAVIVPWGVDAATAPKTALGTTTSGFFLAARSLALVEARTRILGFMCLAGWLAYIIVTVLAAWFFQERKVAAAR